MKKNFNIPEMRAKRSEGMTYRQICKDFGISLSRAYFYLKDVKTPKKPKKVKKSDLEKFLKRVEVRSEDECWEWQGIRTKFGYGHVNYKKYGTYAHRASYILFFGKIPDGLCVCHRCDNPPCVNPKHLFLGTMTDNIRDRHLKGRTRNSKTGKLN